MIVDVSSARPTWLFYVTKGQLQRCTCRLFAPVALGVLLQALTGCTLLGYTIGNAAIPRPQSFSPQNARAIRRGTEVEVFYQLGPNERAPLAGAGSVEGAELSVATGAYAGIEGDKLVLEHSVGPAAVASHETFDLNKPKSVEAVRIVVPLEQVSLIRTKPSPTPAVVGTVVGVAVDVAVVVFWARAARNIQ